MKKRSQNIFSLGKTAVCLVLLFILPMMISAQDFQKAPVKGVKTIVEWVQTNGSSKIQKGYVYRFGKDGKLESYRNDHLKEEYNIEYDHRRKRKKTVSTFGLNSSVSLYSYKSTYEQIEEEYKGNFTKTLSFYEGKKLVEKKSFYKNSQTLGKYQLFERYVYHYDKRDSLRGEMFYNYYSDETKDSPYSRKTLHRYDERTGKKVNITEFGFNRKWQVSTDITYTPEGKIRKRATSFRDGGQQIIRYDYKDGALWQEHINEGATSVVKVYKNGKPIRKKTKDGKFSEVVDYQYEFY